MMWPPTLSELKLDMGIHDADTRDDEQLQQVLDAAISFVESVHAGKYPYDAQIVLGTLRLAGRWHTRRRSPDAVVEMSEMGSSRIPSFDPDIDRLLRIGKYRRNVIA